MQECPNADGLPLCDEADILHRAGHHNLCMRIDLYNTPAAFESVRIRQIHIHCHNVGTEFRITLHRLGSVCRRPAHLKIRIR